MLKKLTWVLLFLLLLAGAVAGIFWKQYEQFLNTPLKFPPDQQVLQVAPGMSINSLAVQLEKAGIIGRAYNLKFHIRLHPELANIKAGEYRLDSQMTVPRLLSVLVQGKTLNYSITLVEGWTFRQMMQAIDQHPQLKHHLRGLSAEQIMQRLGYAGQHPEGRFFPDTYSFPKGFSDEELLRRAYRRMQSILQQAWDTRDPDLPLKSPYQALILASIVEKETGAPEERAEIAGVFIRRLQKGMRLQTDPTVIYGMGDAYKGNIRKQDLRTKTAYNTYMIDGLPPTPICMPGADAIHAATHPKPGNSLYFVAKGGGRHQFSATLRQHNAAVRKYQLKK